MGSETEEADVPNFRNRRRRRGPTSRIFYSENFGMLRDAASEAISMTGPATPITDGPTEDDVADHPVGEINLFTDANDVATEDADFAEAPTEVEDEFDVIASAPVIPETDAAPLDVAPTAELSAETAEAAESNELIRELVENTQIEPEEPKLEITSEEDIPNSPLTLGEQERWEDLRAPLIDEADMSLDAATDRDDPFAQEGHYGEVVQPRDLTPIERVRARQSGVDIASLQDLVASRPFGQHGVDGMHEGAYGAPDQVDPRAAAAAALPGAVGPTGQLPPEYGQTPHLSAPSAHPAVASLAKKANEARVWDTPEDHKMSTSGRVFWHAAIFLAILAYPLYLLFASPYPARDTVAHYAAMTGCNAAVYLGVSEAQLGEPGYHAHLDPNGNGIACEPDVARRLTGGKVTFIRPGDF